MIIIMVLFAIVSGVLVIATIKNIVASDPKLLFRTAVQLVILSVMELAAALALIVGSTIGVAVNTFSVAYGLSTVFPQVVQFFLMTVLIIQSRIYSWQLKELAAKRPQTRVDSSSRAGRKSSAGSKSSAEQGASIDPRTVEEDYSKEIELKYRSGKGSNDEKEALSQNSNAGVQEGVILL